jgi:hypothetical protein
MTLNELQSLFGVSTGIFYEVLKNKTEVEMLTDADQSIFTYSCPGGKFIAVEKEFVHPDYVKVE